MSDIKKIKFYNSDKGIFVSSKYLTRSPEYCLINGKDPIETYDKDWWFVQGEAGLNKIEQKRTGKYRKIFSLKQDLKESLTLDLPEELTEEQVDYETYYEDGDEYVRWGNETYSKYQSLYNWENIQGDPYLEEIEFEGVDSGTIDFSLEGKPENFHIKLHGVGGWSSSKVVESDLIDVCSWDQLDKMLVPSFLIHTRPCHVTSHIAYRIIRNYVKENIDPKWAEVTSDYDFCFEVAKKYQIKPYIRKTEITKKGGKSYSRPRFYTKTISYNTEKVFGMTHDERKYGGYPIISGFKGESLEDLAENIKLYLDELMEYINEPIQECEVCKGTGHLKTKEFKKGEQL